MKTPGQIQSEERAAAAAKFCDAMVGVVRKRLFAGVVEKEWWEHERTVRLAILEPARYLQERGAALPASEYRVILTTVILAIEEHARRAQIRRMAFYFLHCVQEHMKHQGDVYYERGKTPRTAAAAVGSVMRSLRADSRDVTTALAASSAVLGARRLGRKKPTGAGIQEELF